MVIVKAVGLVWLDNVGGGNVVLVVRVVKEQLEKLGWLGQE